MIVPVHNEGSELAGHLAELDDVLCHLAPEQYEVIVVDDASTDHALDAGLINPFLKVIRLPLQRGAGSARKEGVAVARGSFIAWIDGDGTYDPRSLLPLLASLERADQVVGARSTDYGRLRWLRLITKRASFLIASLLWLRWIPDLNSGLRVFRRECLLRWVDQLPSGFSCTSTATLAALNCHQKVVFHPVPYRARIGASISKFHPLFDTLNLLKTILRLRLWAS